MSDDLVTIMSQFGPAGLMGLLWILERRHAGVRERQLSEAHRQLVGGQQQITALLDLVRDNTRAIVTLEQTQRHLARVAERIDQRLAQPVRKPTGVLASESSDRAAEAA